MTEITITLQDQEALVLFDFLTRFSDSSLLGTEDQAEQRALWDLQCLLERELPAILDPEYRAHLKEARDAVRDEGGTDAETELTKGRLAFWLEPETIAFLADEWRKLPDDMPESDRQVWADVAFRAMSALRKAGVVYNAKLPRYRYSRGKPLDDVDGTASS